MPEPLFVFLDAETYFDREYSLQRMTTREYVLDPRFEEICWTIKVAKGAKVGPTLLVRKPDIAAAFAAIPWSEAIVVAHNMMFDGAILSWRHGIRPRFWIDTLSMAQALFAHKGMRCDLGSLAKLVNRHKDRQALENMRGVPYAGVDWESPSGQRYAAYAVEDTETLYAIYHEMMLTHQFPPKELAIIDIVMRMYFEHGFVLDANLVAAHLASVKEAADYAAKKAGTTAAALRSKERFAALLRDAGVENPPTKISATTDEEDWAFAKSDQDFIALFSHESERVRDLCHARLLNSSSIERTRSERFLKLANTGDGRLNVPLKYSGAHTHRFSGLDKLNLQNLTRGGALRRSLKAPPGMKVVAGDASQIEARMTASVAGQQSICRAFAAGEDVYSTFASVLYGYAVNKHDHKAERFVGKTGILGLGYGCGAAKFQWMLAREQPKPLEFCKDVVRAYRDTYPAIPELWRAGDRALEAMANGGGGMFGPAILEHEAMLLPSGLRLHYPKLHSRYGEKGWEFAYRHARKGDGHKIWGGHLTENLIQALARIVITEAMLVIRAKFPQWHIALQVHDEIVLLVPEQEAEQAKAVLVDLLRVRPSWAPESLALDAEAGIGDTYGDAK